MKLLTMEKKTLARSPRLDTVLMVERFIQEKDGEYKKKQLWENLPKKMMYQTYSVIIDYLLISGKISVEIKNTGYISAANVEWSITVKGGILDGINSVNSGEFEKIKRGKSESIRAASFFGLGKVTIDIEVTAEHPDPQWSFHREDCLQGMWPDQIPPEPAWHRQKVQELLKK